MCKLKSSLLELVHRARLAQQGQAICRSTQISQPVLRSSICQLPFTSQKGEAANQIREEEELAFLVTKRKLLCHATRRLQQSTLIASREKGRAWGRRLGAACAYLGGSYFISIQRGKGISRVTYIWSSRLGIMHEIPCRPN